MTDRSKFEKEEKMGGAATIGDGSSRCDFPREKIKVAMVFLYGHDPVNSPLKLHLDNVVRVGNQEGITRYILCGGCSEQKSFPGVSEAMAAFNYLKPLLPKGSKFILEENSLTTYENVKFGTFHFKTMYRGVEELLVFVEATRVLKVALLMRHFLPEFHPGKPEKKIRFETASWEQMDPRKELLATIHDYLSISFPYLARRFRKKREKRALTL